MYFTKNRVYELYRKDYRYKSVLIDILDSYAKEFTLKYKGKQIKTLDFDRNEYIRIINEYTINLIKFYFETKSGMRFYCFDDESVILLND